MAVKFMACAYPSRTTTNGFTKQEVLIKYRDWVDGIQDVTKEKIQDDLYMFAKICPFARYACVFIDAKERIPLQYVIDGFKLRVAFVSKVQQ